MESIKIGTNIPKEKIDEIILSNPFTSRLDMKNETFDNNEFFIFNIDKHRLEEVKQFNSLAKLVQNIINRFYMKDIIETKLSNLLMDYNQGDIDYLGFEVLDMLIDDVHFKDEKNKINEEIKDYLLENNTMMLDGYLRFRSRSFDNLVDKIIKKLFMDIQLENEYEDFIDMLQYYLDIQLPKVDTVNVVVKNNEFILLDQKNRPIESESIKSILEEYKIDDITKADVLVSSLIVLAPNKVIVHIKNDNEKDLMQVLKRIFTKRLTFCYSCDLCDLNITKTDNE